MRSAASILAVPAFLALICAAPRAAESAAGAGGTEILGAGSYVRWHVTHSPPLVEKEPGKAEPLPYRGDNSNFRGCDHDVSAPPPAGWTGLDFDDSSWPRTALKWMDNAQGRKMSQAVLSVRGKFAVTDTAAALEFSARYRGGIRVFLNGKEIARAHLPEGDLKPGTPGEAYPREAYVNAKGEIINQRGGRIAEEDKPRVAGRDRTLGPVKLPADALRRGVNVLAVEVRRAHYDPSSLNWWKYPAETGKYPWWRTGELMEIGLRAAGAGVTPNTGRPAGVQVWVQDRNDRVYGADYGDPNEPLEKYPLRIAAARNASFCAQLVAGCDQPLKGVAVKPGGIKALQGAGVIPAENVVVLYALPTSIRNIGTCFRDLAAGPPDAPGQVQPVLLRIRIPRDAPAGDYRGEVAVSASGRSFKVPVEVSVADWTVPDPREYRTYMGIYQSPTSVAMQYKLESWSDEHFRRLEKSFDLLARIGNRMVNIPVVDETQFGNPEGMIYWIDKGQGKYEYDFSVFDRFMKMVVEKCGKQDYVCLQIWHAGGWSARGVDNKCTVQLKDPATGKRTPMQVPLWGKPEAAAFWKPFFAAVQARLEKLEMPGAMTVGILSDSTAPNEVFQTMSDAWPDGTARWHRGCHSATGSKTPYGVSKVGKNVVSLHEHCYGMSMVRPEKWATPLHDHRGRPGTAYFRVSNHVNNTGWHHARTMSERALWTQKQGIGRVCLDFWPVMEGKRGATDVYNRYPHSSCAQREPSLKSMTWPAPEGAAANLRFEALAEGLAESEALIVVSEALFTRRDALGAELAAACEKVLADRLAFLWFCTENTVGHYHTYHWGWQELNRRLFDCAARSAKKAGAK